MLLSLASVAFFVLTFFVLTFVSPCAYAYVANKNQALLRLSFYCDSTSKNSIPKYTFVFYE